MKYSHGCALVKLIASNLHLVYSDAMKQLAAKQDDLKSILRKAGLKATPSRLLVLGLLGHADKPMSAQNVIDAVGAKADQATVYRMLKDFKDRGLITPIDLRHNHAHYEIANTEEHHHLVCTRCGMMEDVSGCELEATYASILRETRRFAAVNQHALEFYGVCKRCVKGTPAV
jgi:Fe2+ or Zn2+ uptake regulation protein